MVRHRLLWKLYLTYVIVIVLCTGAVSLHALGSVRAFYFSQTERDLKARAELVRSQIQAEQLRQSSAELASLCKALGRRVATRITIIRESGEVLADSEVDLMQMKMENHGDRPEVKAAMATGFGRSIRHSGTLNEDMMYVALAISDGPAVAGVVRLALPLTEVNRELTTIYFRIAASAIFVTVVAAGLGLVVSLHITRPLREMEDGARRFADGDFAHKLLVPRTKELGSLAEAMNQMAAELDAKIRILAQQKNEQDAILSSMIEGFIAIDSNGRILRANRVAASWVAASQSGLQGRGLQEIVRNVDLERLVDRVAETGQPVEDEVVLRDGAERFLQVHGTVLRDSHGQPVGVLLVLNDVTRLRRLETVRRDFVANVSHELRTPITSIKGFVETLREGAINDREQAFRFLEIIERQAERLNSIIEDLLSLSRIEQETERAEIPLKQGKIKAVLEAAVGDCQGKATERHMQIALHCDDGLTARINPPILEQAVVNLIDNAIKFSEPGSPVSVEAAGVGEEIVISVRDRGCGIEAQHLPRIFERFYRVDKARSRKLGGTGLGLAIVKHIAQAHGGRVSVESSPGVGSTFRMHLPKMT